MPERLEPIPCCGRSFIVRGEFCAGALPGRFEPKPCGARPRSVVLPCASQVRELVPGRCTELLPAVPFMDRLPFGIAEGGRFWESSRCRAVIPALPFPRALPGRFSIAPLTLALPCTPELPICPLALAEPLACGLPKRPAFICPPFTARTGECEAPAAGVVRAMTERFCTALEGRATFEWKFALPSALCGVGRMPTEFVTFAPFKEAWVMCWFARLTRSPFMKPLREVVVTARKLCAFTKLKFRLLNTFTFRIKVLLTLMMLMNVWLQPNHGKNGSPHPRGNQPTPKPNPKPQPPPSQPTNAGPKTGGPKNGPGHQPHAPPMNAQRP